MAFQPEIDDLSAFESKETARKIPVGWALLFWGLVVWGAYYLWAYSPALGGWSQTQDLEGGGASTGTNVLATIAFTAIPTAVAIVLWLGQRKRKA
jgi:hypothetical protein